MGKRVLLGATGLAVAAGLVLFGFSTRAADSYTFTARGIVKSLSSDTKEVRVYFTHASSEAQNDLLGNTVEIKVGPAKIYAWTKDANGKLYKKRVTSSQLKPGKEIVVNGTKRAENSYTAAWVVINYRKFVMDGKLQGLERDNNSTETGWITVGVTASDYKKPSVVGQDVRMRVSDATVFKALGNVKAFNDITVNQQKVRVSGEVTESAHYGLTEVVELN